MNVHGYTISRVNGPGLRFVLWTQGCSKGCKNCFNPLTWSNEKNKIFTNDNLLELIKNFEDIDGITITGGDPFEQEYELLELLFSLSSFNFKKGIIVYTGFTIDEINENPIRRKCLDYLDILIDGRYVEENKISSGLKGSSNQNVFYFSDKVKEEEINIDQEIEIGFSEDTVFLTGFPVNDKKFLKDLGISLK
jgi:anaerobic ribonucleoside-triphosphate reductase activating protein